MSPYIHIVRISKLTHIRYFIENCMHLCSVKQVNFTTGIVCELVPSFRSAFDNNDELMSRLHHVASMAPTQWGGVKMVRIQYLPTTAVDCRSETCLVAFPFYPGGQNPCPHSSPHATPSVWSNKDRSRTLLVVIDPLGYKTQMYGFTSIGLDLTRGQ